jgi:uncharacterized membrane protein
MSKMIVVVFDSERQAYEGTRVLKELHAEGNITVYGEAVVVKDAGGNVTIKQAADQGPTGTAVGMLTGALVGLIGGPIGVAVAGPAAMAAGAAMGVAVGSAAGTLGGATYDLVNLGVGEDFLDEAAITLAPGKAAVVAEIQEEWVTPLDTRMEAVGGTVFRRTRGEFVDAQVARDVAALEADLDALDAEMTQATGEAKAKLQARIDATRAKLHQAQQRARAKAEAVQLEREAKMAALKAQASGATAERRAQIEKRSEEIQAEYEERTAKLEQAGRLTKEALAP